MYKKFNISFICLILFTLGFIGLFNYFVDPYNLIFNRESFIELSHYKKDMIGPVLKMSKKSKYDVLVFGGSVTYTFLLDNIMDSNKRFVFIANGKFPLDELLDYATFFLELHPEIKTVIYSIEYHSYYDRHFDTIPAIKSKNLSFQEIFSLFLSIQTTKLSIEKFIENPQTICKNIKSIKNNIRNLHNEQDINIIPTLQKKEKSEYKIYYNRQPASDQFRDGIFEYLNKVINVLENGNFEVQYIIPPYHALLQSKIYKKNNYQDIENIKRLFVQKTNKPIKDFAYINKHTTENLHSTYLYIDTEHPISYRYNTFYCALANPEKYKQEDIFIDLTNDNIDSVMKQQKELLEKYIRENNEYINKFLNTSPTRHYDFITKSTDKAPECI